MAATQTGNTYDITKHHPLFSPVHNTHMFDLKAIEKCRVNDFVVNGYPEVVLGYANIKILEIPLFVKCCTVIPVQRGSAFIEGIFTYIGL